MVPPAEAPGSLSPARPRTPLRTCSGLRPPEEGRAQASRKVREEGEGRPRLRVGGLASFAGPPGPSAGPRPGPTPPERPAPVARPTSPADPLRSGAPAFPRGFPRGGGSGGRSGPKAAGRGGRAWLVRAVAQPPGSGAGAGLGGPGLPLPGLRNGSSQQPKFCLVPQGASFPTATLGRNYGDLLSFIKGNKHKHTHARNLSAPAHGCVPGFVAQSPASPSGRFRGCQLWRRECV